MKSSFHRGRSTTASMAARARVPENQVSKGTTGTPVTPEFRAAGHASKDATKRNPRALGAALRFYRGERSLARVAKAAKTKRSHLSALENGESEPRPSTLGRLAEVLGVTIPEIYAFADLLAVAPELLNRTAEPAGLRSMEGAVRWAMLLRAAEPALLPFRLPVLVVGRSSQLSAAEANQEAAALWARLRPYSPAERRSIVQEGEEYQVWALCRLLCEESIEAAADDPAEALELARLAELIAPLVAGSAEWRARLSGYCGFHVTNAFRVCGSLPAAGEALERAEIRWNAGAGSDPEERLTEARVLDLKASLRREQRQLVEALDLHDKSLAVDRGGMRAHLLINRAKTLEEMGDYKTAAATLYDASPHIDASREHRLLLIQRFNLSVNFCRLGCYAEAERLLSDMQALAQKVAKGVAKVRIEWLHGWIAAGMGRLEEAEAGLTAVREEFLARDIGYDAALASLDLAKLYLQQGRTAEVKNLAGQMVAVFQEQGVHREALAAVQLFQEAAERENATVELVCRMADFLRRARHDAELRFAG